MSKVPQLTLYDIIPYEPAVAPFDMRCIHAFWLITGPDGKNRTVPIPHEDFMEYLSALDD